MARQMSVLKASSGMCIGFLWFALEMVKLPLSAKIALEFV
jgi:hypothetical protein